MSRIKRFELDCSDSPSLTKQADKDACDINKILKRFTKTGALTHMSKNIPQYGDFTQVPDFFTAASMVAEASQAFDQLPANLRKRFHNDPAVLIDFCNDPKNLDEAISLGLATKPKEEPKFEPKAPIAPVEGAKEGVKA